MSDIEYVVRNQSGKWEASKPVHFSQLGPAISYAKQRSIHTGDPHQIYAVELIGASSAPKSDFIDYRPAAAPEKVSALR